MVKLSFFGGVNQIGGNKILLEDKSNDAKIFLDFGMNFTDRMKYFEEFIQPRTANGIIDFLELNLLPNIEGIYRQDLLEFAGMKKHKEPIVDAVLISHAHLDHSAHVSFLDDKIPIFSSEITKTILRTVQDTGPRKMEFEILDYKKRPLLNLRDGAVSRSFNTVKGKFKINGLEIEIIPVDHSVFGACGYIVYGSDKTVAYTGDLRLHGTYGYLTKEFIEKLKLAKPDIFICEGTRIDKTDSNSEAYVKVNSNKVISQTKGLVIVDFAYKDLTRFTTFFEIAKENNRKLVIPFKDAYFLKEMSKVVPNLPSIDDENILIYQEKKGSGTYREQDYANWEKEFLDRKNTVKADYIHKHQGELIICLGYYDMPDLIDIKPNVGSVYIRSSSEAFNEEEEIDMQRLKNWLNHFGLSYHHFHASGHINRIEIAEMIKEVKPKAVIPIHTDKVGEFGKIVGKGIKVEFAKLSN